MLMQAYIGVIILCTVSGLLACIVHEICNKERNGAKSDKSYIDHIIRTFIFYVIVFHTILSLFKILLGDGAMTLIESFDEVSWRTYLHYSLPLTVIAVITPIILKKIFGKKADSFVSLTDSVILSIYMITYLIFSTVNNIWCSCIAICGMLSALLIVLFYKGKISYCKYKSIKKRLKIAAPIILFWIVLMMLYLPNELYLGNVEDMSLPYSIFITVLLIGSLIYFVAYTAILVYFLTTKQFSFVCELIFAISLACFIQEMFLNGKMNVMDGSMQTWSRLTIVVNAVIWIVIIGSIVSLKFIIKKNVDKKYAMICIYLSIIQLVTWGYLRISTHVERTYSDFELTTEARFELDPEHNVIVFVLDWYDAQILDRLIAKNDDFLEPLKDFTWYKNTTSLYAFTTMSVPYMLTGVEWQYDMTEDEYSNYAFGNSTLLYDIADKDYDVCIYTEGHYLPVGIKDVVRNYMDVTFEGWKYAGIYKQMLSCSKYKSYPFVLKSRYWYADGDLARAMKGSGIHTTTHDEPFYNELHYSGIQVRQSGKYEGALRFYHLHGMHIPFVPDIESQGEFSMNIVYEYLEQLKDAGLYDEATIIVTADHGQNYIAMEDMLEKYDLDIASSPILFVKKSGQTNENGPTISMAPVSHAEFPATLIEAVYGDTLGYGDTFEDIAEDTERIRYFEYRRHDDIPYVKYSINGYVRDWNNWTLEAQE